MKDKSYKQKNKRRTDARMHAHTDIFLLLNEKAPKSTTKRNISWPIDKTKQVGNFSLEEKTAPSFLSFKNFCLKTEFQLISIEEKKIYTPLRKIPFAEGQ